MASKTYCMYLKNVAFTAYQLKFSKQASRECLKTSRCLAHQNLNPFITDRQMVGPIPDDERAGFLKQKTPITSNSKGMSSPINILLDRGTYHDRNSFWSKDSTF